MKRIKKFSMISSGAEAITESANENQEAVMNLLNKMGYTSIDELKKEKNLLSKLEALVKEFDAKKDISEEEIEEDRAEDIEAEVKAKGKPKSLEAEEGDKEEDGEVGGSDTNGEVAEEEEVEEDMAKDVEDAVKAKGEPKEIQDKAPEKVTDDQEVTDEVSAEADDETSGRKIKTFEEYIKEKEVTVNKNIKYHDDDDEPEDYALPVADSAKPLAEDDEEEGEEDERKGDDLEDKGDKKVDSEDDKEKEDHYKGAVKSDDEEIDALKKDVEYDKEEEEDAKKDESKIMSFSKFITEAYDKVVWGGDEGDKSKTHDGEDYEDEDEDEEKNEKYDKVVWGGDKGDKSKTHDGEDYEDEDEKDESVEENVAEIITKIEGDELAGEEAGADGIAIPAVGGDGPETAAGIAGDMMDMGKPKNVEGKGKDLITKDQEITEVVPEEKDEDEKVDGIEVSESQDLKEKEITDDKGFEEYATEVLKSAHGDKFDEAKAKETIDGLISKYKDDYGAMVGALQSSMG